MRKNNKKNADSLLDKVSHTFHVTYDVLWSIILFFLVIVFIGLFFAGGTGAGYFASLVKDEPIRSYASMKKDIYEYEETSELYFDDDILIGEISAELHRDDTTLDKISETLTNAVLATEDESFYEHKGVVPKAIIRAIVQEATNANMKTGGSTLTQQLIKLQVLTNEVSFDRKAKEILLALRLEESFDKDEILEVYLNIIPYGRNASGRNIAGVQTAAKGIFDVNADDVNLPQAAYLAGLPQSPYAYTPFQNGGGLKDEEGLEPGLKRMKIVLKRMLDSNYINQEEYSEALKYDLVADFTEKKSSTVERYPYLVQDLEKEASDILINILAEEDGYTLEDLDGNNEESKILKEQYEELAKRELKQNGYNIHSTINKEIYDNMQETMKDISYLGPERTFTDKDSGEEFTERVQAAAVLKENHTGKIISFVGGPGFERGANEINYLESLRNNGSTMKPILDYGPALEEGKIQPGSPVPDIKRTYDDGTADGYTPINYSSTVYYGINSARLALAKSYNVSAHHVYHSILDGNPAKKYLEKMGITTLTEEDYVNQSLAIGSPSKGIKIKENIGSFSTFGNDGKFVDDYMIEKITTPDGEVVFEHEIEAVDVFSPETSYLTVDMMRDVLSEGTATYLKSLLKNGSVDWAGKTGTSKNFEDQWFIATNPHVTFGTWIGYNTPANLEDNCAGCSLSGSQRVQKLWADLINNSAEIDAELVTPKDEFKQPEGVVERSFCAISGMLPSELCKKAGLVKTDLFNIKYVPTEVDDSLITGNYVTVDGKSVIADSKTPSEFIKGDGLSFNPEFLKRNGYDKLDDISELYPRSNPSAWKKISAPSGKMGGKIKDDGSTPSPPTSLKATNNKLSWNKSSSKDVVGYRVYYSNKPGGNLSRLGSTTSTERALSGGAAVFYVKAVNYFGRESSSSSPVTVGELPSEKRERQKKEKEKAEQEEKAQEKKEKEEAKQEEKAQDKKEKAEQEKKAQEKKDKEDAEQEKKAQEKKDKEDAEQEKKAQEKKDKEDAEQEKKAQEKKDKEDAKEKKIEQSNKKNESNN